MDCKATTKYITLINPECRIPTGAICIHGISDDMVRNAPTINMVMPSLLTFLGNSLLVAHNASFDIGFIEEWARRCGNDAYWNYVDTVSVARRLIIGLPNYKQKTVLDAIGYKQSQYHRAEDDCRGCAEIVLLALNSTMGNETPINTESVTTYRQNEFDYKKYEAREKKYGKYVGQHFKNIEKIETMYSVLVNSDALFSEQMDKLIELCYADISLAATLKEYWLAEFTNSELPHYVSFKRLSIIYEKRKDYDRAIDVCINSINLGYLKDGNNSRMYGRIARLCKKANRPIPADILSCVEI